MFSFAQRVARGSAAVLLAGTALSQPAPPAFEVTSVKPNPAPLIPARPGEPTGRHEMSCSPGGRFVSIGELLIRPILFAYNVAGFQLAGLPNWAREGFVDIEATSAGPVSTAQYRLMVQKLLTDRFQMVVHRETKEMPVYALVAGKNGPKMREAGNPGAGAKFNGRLQRIAPDGSETPNGWTMKQLADALLLNTMQSANRPAVDRTGLKGVYEFNLEFDQFPGIGHSDQPDVFTAVQDQLGLKLEERKEPFEMLIIDRLEKPSAN